MGKQVSVIQVNGRVGEVVGAKSMKGDNILRTHRATIANPNTILQQRQRTKFLCATNFSSQVPKDAIKGLLPYAKNNRCTLRNAITKLYLRDGRLGGQPSEHVIFLSDTGANPGDEMYAQVQPLLAFFSKGPLPKPNGGAISAENPLEVVVKDHVAAGIDRARTNLVVILYNPELGFITDTVALPAEGDCTVTFNVPMNWNGVKVHAYSYYQGFDTADKRDVYYDAVGRGSMSTAKALETNAEYSDTYYHGSANVQ